MFCSSEARLEYPIIFLLETVPLNLLGRVESEDFFLRILNLLSLKVPSHQIRLGLKYNVWIGLGKYRDRRW